MLNKNSLSDGSQMEIICLEQVVPKNHLLRKIDASIDFSFIYDLVTDLYCLDNGRPSIDPVLLIKIVLLQYLYGIKSIRQTIKDIEVNVAYRWFLGIGLLDDVPHFSTFSQNYRRRFEGTDIFDQIFQNILLQASEKGFVDSKIQFVDSTHVKAHANRHKNHKRKVAETSRSYQKKLEEEINEDRKKKGKKPFDPPKSPPSDKEKSVTKSNTDPESGLFHKGEHKEVFAYSVQTSCDKNGWILNYECYLGNEHDSTTFNSFYEEKIKKDHPDKLVMDAGYKTNPIANKLRSDDVTAVFPYTRSKGSRIKDGFYKKEYIYSKAFDCYLCPEGEILNYSTTDRSGYRHYKSKPSVCEKCKNLKRCTKDSKCQRTVTRHIWQDLLDECDQYRLTDQGKAEYKRRKETIERVFGTAKEHHGFRYTNMVGKSKMKMKASLTYACMNMKKLSLLVTKDIDLEPCMG